MGRRTRFEPDEDIQDLFKTGLCSELERSIAFANNESTFASDALSLIWKDVPPTVETFFDSWFPEPLWPEQRIFVEAMFGEDPLSWNMEFDEGHAFWGKGSGKDRTIAKSIVYSLVKLLHMRNPQQGLNYFLGEKGGIGIDSALDIINVSKDARQARNVFFKNIKSIMRKTVNPKTGRNFFEEQGVDLRDAKDIQSVEIKLPHEITLHSLNSKEYTGEGLNILFAVIDELGSYPSYSKVETQLDSIRKTINSRFPHLGKLYWLSFKYKQNCPATIEYKLGEDEPRIFSHKKKTWEVNITKTKTDFSRDYRRNQDRATMTFECEDAEGGGGFIKVKSAIDACICPGHLGSPGGGENPIVGNILTTDAPMFLQFKDWFRGRPNLFYTAHIDLAKGKIEEDGDAAGFTLVHPENMIATYDEKYTRALKESGVMVDDTVKSAQKGIITDLSLQIIAPKSGEIQLDDIVNFALLLKTKFAFNIRYITLDGWQSLGSIQKLNKKGIEAEVLSVDKSDDPYSTLKELIYQGLYRCYEHPTLRRELKELDRNEKGMIDHPEKSYDRFLEEGVEKGSKDVADSVAGSSYICMERISTGLSVAFG